MYKSSTYIYFNIRIFLFNKKPKSSIEKRKKTNSTFKEGNCLLRNQTFECYLFPIVIERGCSGYNLAFLWSLPSFSKVGLRTEVLHKKVTDFSALRNYFLSILVSASHVQSLRKY